jgi:WD40 repeat protein
VDRSGSARADAEHGPDLAAAAIPGRDPADPMLLPPAAPITCAATAPGGILAVGWGHTVALLDMATLRPLRLLPGHRAGVLSVAFSPDGTTLASSDGGDGTVRLWEVATGRQLRELTGHHGRVLSVAAYTIMHTPAMAA